MNIILTGMRGSGKSKIGRLLAEKLGREFIDLDAYIERFANKKITQLVEEHGWNHFRDLEKKAAKEVSQKDNLVISTGGGTFVDPENAEIMKENGTVILLTADIDVLEERIGRKNTRPALTTHENLKEELKEIWEERKDIYKKNADYVFDNSSQNPPESKIGDIIEMFHL